MGVNSINLNEVQNHQPLTQTVKFIKLWQAIILGGVIAAIFAWGAVSVGENFFWNQFDRTPLVQKEYQHALAMVNQDPNSADNHVELGWSLYQLGQYNNALAEYQKAINIQPNDFQAYYNLGLTYKQIGKTDLAITTLQKALQLAPKSFDVHYDLGLVYQETGKLDLDLQELKLANQLNPGSTDVVYALGQTYEKKGDKNSAIEQYQAAIEFDPKYVKAEDALKRLGGN